MREAARVPFYPHLLLLIKAVIQEYVTLEALEQAVERQARQSRCKTTRQEASPTHRANVTKPTMKLINLRSQGRWITSLN